VFRLMLSNATPRRYAAPMLVEQSSTYHGAVMAVFDKVKTQAWVGPVHIEAIPILGRILLLANRSGLTDEEVFRQMQDTDELRALADRGTHNTDAEVGVAGA
jgi:hypothetical protein